MKGYTPNPTIRILMLGAEGVGKNCIESRFTTKLYPPPYNPALTLNSRRFFTLPRCPDDHEAEAHHGEHRIEGEELADKEKKQVVVGMVGKTAEASASDCPPTAASSGIASSSHGSPSTPNSPNSPNSADAPSLDLDERTLVNSEGVCSECVRENNTYLVIVINYPALHKSVRVRKQVHSKANYDAVLLVYDVCDCASFSAITTLHAEIPVCTRKIHYSHHRRAAPHASATRSRTAGWFGGGGNDLTGHTGSGEIVVGLVGNKSDVDAKRQSPTMAEEVKPVIETSISTGRDISSHGGLLSPLYHESIMYEELMAGIEREKQKMAALPESPKKTSAPALPQDEFKQELNDALKEEDIQKWLQISRLEPPLESDKNIKSPGDAVGSPGSPQTGRSRLISMSDGEALVRQLNLTVPFRETSAKTGDNIEAVFENLVREVLREMGRDASGTNKAGKTCRHKANLGKIKSRDSQVSVERSLFPSSDDDHHRSQPPPSVVSEATVISTVAAGEEDRERRPESAIMFGEAHNADSSAPNIAVGTVVSGDSKMGRMRKIFMRRGQNIAV